MSIKEAIEICEEMQKWRRGEDGYDEPGHIPYSPKEFGEAIDELIFIAKARVS